MFFLNSILAFWRMCCLAWVRIISDCSGLVSSITRSLSTCLLPNTGVLGLVGIPCLITVGMTGLTSPLGGTGGGNTDTVERASIGTSLFSFLLNLSIHLLVGLAWLYVSCQMLVGVFWTSLKKCVPSVGPFDNPCWNCPWFAVVLSFLVLFDAIHCSSLYRFPNSDSLLRRYTSFFFIQALQQWQPLDVVFLTLLLESFWVACTPNCYSDSLKLLLTGLCYLCCSMWQALLTL